MAENEVKIQVGGRELSIVIHATKDVDEDDPCRDIEPFTECDADDPDAFRWEVVICEYVTMIDHDRGRQWRQWRAVQRYEPRMELSEARQDFADAKRDAAANCVPYYSDDDEED